MFSTEFGSWVGTSMEQPVRTLSRIILAADSIFDWCSDSESWNRSRISDRLRSSKARFLIFRLRSASKICLTDANRLPPFSCRSFPKRPSKRSDCIFPRRTYDCFFWRMRNSIKDARPSVVCFADWKLKQKYYMVYLINLWREQIYFRKWAPIQIPRRR